MEDIKAVMLGSEQSAKSFWIEHLGVDEHHRLMFHVDETKVSLLLNEDKHGSDTGLFLLTWDGSRNEEDYLEDVRIYFERQLYEIQEQFRDAEGTVAFQNLPIVFLCKIDELAVIHRMIDVYQLKNAQIVTTPEEFQTAVAIVLGIKTQTNQDAALIAAFNNLDYSETELAHTRGARFANLNVPEFVQKNPKQLTADEFEWLLRQWQTINDRKSVVSLWIERRLAYALGIYSDLTVPYNDEHKRRFSEYLEANPVSSLPKVDQTLQLLSRRETGFFIKIGCFFSSTYWEKIKQEKVFIFEIALHLNTCAKLGTAPNFNRWGELPEDIDRIVKAPRIVK